MMKTFLKAPGSCQRFPAFVSISESPMTALFFCLLNPPELTKTLIVTGLDNKTTAETLKNAFEGAARARVIIKKKTKVSERRVV